MISIQQHNLLILRPSRRRIGIKPQPLKRVEQQRAASLHAVIHFDGSALVVGEFRMRSDLEHDLCVPGLIHVRVRRNWPLPYTAPPANHP